MSENRIMEHKTGTDLFLVDNSDADWKVLRYLHDWCQISRQIDIATGYFEIGSLLSMKDEWQKVERIRILMGDEVSKRTKSAFEEGLKIVRRRLDASLETEKQQNDFLSGVPGIVDGIRSGRIQCRVYRKGKFHAKAYITHARLDVVGSAALVGSSNFTLPGLSENIELNVQITGRPVTVLQEWYETHWNEAEDVTPDILRVIEHHIRDYSPFEVYAQSLHEFFRGHEMTAGEWELGASKMYPVLSQYQRQGYQSLMRIASQFNGAFLCDGVGLGKTFVGLMLIERLVLKDRRRVALFVPKAARADVWESHLEQYLPDLKGKSYSNLAIFNHTDLGREGDFPDEFRRVAEMADVVIIDEAHHFRNPGIKGEGERRPSRYRLLFDLLESGNGPKQLFMLTATPINNKLDDFRHMAELFTRQQEDYFKARLGIHSLRGHFVRLERELRKTLFPGAAVQLELPIELNEAESALSSDTIFKALVVQRSRAYVRESQRQEGCGDTIFPEREPPKVIEYSVKKTYGRLLELVDRAFEKENPLLILGIYYPLAYYKGAEKIDPLQENRQKQVVGLIRTQFLKRFESSALAFGLSCDRMLLRLLAWVTKHSDTDAEKRRLEIWKTKHGELIGYVREQQLSLWGEEEPDDADEDIVTDEMLEHVEQLSRDEFRVEDIMADSYEDMNQLVEFLQEFRRFESRHDDKLKALVRLLKNDPILKRDKVLIFSEFAETARYLKKQLRENGIEGVDEIDSMSHKNRSEVIRRFAPYYNGTSSAWLAADGQTEIRILISTDVLSEGLNLQDATRLINYDLHWNPVRLMQRIGRVDRRMNVDIEAMIVRDHPEQKKLRGRVVYWNFLPPDDLDSLLRLYTKVSHKTLRISKTFGIEGRKLLRPEDEYDALKDFNHSYEGTVSAVEKMHLEYQQLLRDHPGLAAQIEALPAKIFSGKEHPGPGTKSVFFCYALPAVAPAASGNDDGKPRWSTELGTAAWYLADLATERIVEEPTEIVEIIRSASETPRVTKIERKTLSEIRANVEKHIKNTYLKQVQAPVGVKPALKAWMELS